MTSIDDFDLKILTLLQTNGRLTNQELSDLVGLSASQCSRRRINLEQANLILGYHARLSPDAVGLGMIGLIEVRLINHTPEYVESFHRMVAEQSSIVDAYKTTGDADYLLKVAVADLAGLSSLISQLVAGHQSVAHVKTSVVLNRLKENGLMMLPAGVLRQNGA
ncbi:Lrp/AsnC family transcriptional regulator [Pantoea sp. B65]|uniref:Lrp/AsnC family transcriptional regulator n=1 Tax=Pantoea sp. B65 TaxID=2813359 RepID=UPI0039B67714